MFRSLKKKYQVTNENGGIILCEEGEYLRIFCELFVEVDKKTHASIGQQVASLATDAIDLSGLRCLMDEAERPSRRRAAIGGC